MGKPDLDQGCEYGQNAETVCVHDQGQDSPYRPTKIG